MGGLSDILFGNETEVEHRADASRHARPDPTKVSPFAGINNAGRGRKGASTATAGGAVVATAEFRRVEAIPRRVLDLTKIPDLTPEFIRPGSKLFIKPLQSAALLEAAMMNGEFNMMPVGSGKTLVTLLLPTALDSKCAVLFVPAPVRKQLDREIRDFYDVHFKVPLDVLTILTYHDLSQAKNYTLLERLAPDLIIADEAHNLRHRSAARTKVFLQFMRENPATRFVPLSGTMTNRSPIEFGHLSELSLRKSSPVPRNYNDLVDWDGALGVKPEVPMRPGALMRFCVPGETVRQGFRRRLVETEGVIASGENEVGASLIIRKVDRLALPMKVNTLYVQTKKTWSLAGEEFSDPMARARILGQLGCGFYYRWVWPGGEPDWEWLDARSAWNKAVTEKLKQSLRGMTSMLLLANAAERSIKGGEGPKWPAGVDVWLAWKEVRDRPEPPKETIWVDDFLVNDAIQRTRTLAKDAPTIVWYEHVAVGERIAKTTGWTQYGAGTDASPSRERIIVASMTVQGTGKNLQHHFVHNVFTSIPPNGAELEQAIGRTHRPGQKADVVTMTWYGHTEESRGAMVKAIADAEYQRDLTGQDQKLLFATKIDDSDDQ